MASNEDVVYAVVRNIPPSYHSVDLRNYFSQFVETGGFHCFHFRHRPEVQVSVNQNGAGQCGAPESTTNVTSAPLESAEASVRDHLARNDVLKSTKTTCCVVRLTEIKRDELISLYHKKHWLDKNGDSMRALCFILPVKLTDADNEDNRLYKTRQEQRQIPADRELFTKADLQRLPEMNPPTIMPNGNVGTQTKVFLKLIKECKLPPVVIKKLGLTFPKTRSNKKYGDVPFDYGGEVVDGISENEDVEVRSGKGHLVESERSDLLDTEKTAKEYPADSEMQDNIKSAAQEVGTNAERKQNAKRKKQGREKMRKEIDEDIEGVEQQLSESGEDDDFTCEEWERHEALHDDPANIERNKEKLFEEKIELKWEKGGSGLVFYTDAQYWAQQEGDFDEQTADDWDVDMSVYYDEHAGDKDARDYITIRQEKRRRDGLEDTSLHEVEGKIGKFEKHTKGIGRRVLERQGWREGQGVGASQTGLAQALDNDGQKPYDKTGFGYHGEKKINLKDPRSKPQRRNIHRHAASSRQAERSVYIGTVYDNPQDSEPQDTLLRRTETTTLKYRNKLQRLDSTKDS